MLPMWKCCWLLFKINMHALWLLTWQVEVGPVVMNISYKIKLFILDMHAMDQHRADSQISYVVKQIKSIEFSLFTMTKIISIIASTASKSIQCRLQDITQEQRITNTFMSLRYRMVYKNKTISPNSWLFWQLQCKMSQLIITTGYVVHPC